MPTSNENYKITEELKWISKRENTFLEKVKNKGVFGILVPLGCFVTAGILANGVYSMVKRNSQKQQRLMRYRVLAQGITIAIAAVGILQFNKL